MLIQIIDIPHTCPYPAKIKWGPPGGPRGGKTVVFKNHKNIL